MPDILRIIIYVIIAIIGIILAIYLWTLIVRALKATDHLADIEEARLIIESKSSGIDVKIEGRKRRRTESG